VQTTFVKCLVTDTPSFVGSAVGAAGLEEARSVADA
jgi:hypothetical protein